MASRYLNIRNTWDAACATSLAGALYVGAVVTVVTRGTEPQLVMGAFGVAAVVSLPFTVVGAATVGWWLAVYIGNRVERHRLLVFTMAGMLVGVALDLLMVIIMAAVTGDPARLIPHGVENWLLNALAMTVLPFYLMVAGLVAGLRWAQIEAKETERINRM